MNKKILSIIIPSYNSNELLTRTLNSLDGILSDYVELIIVDDGSSIDQKKYVKTNLNYKFIQQKNLGLGLARNAGALEAVGDYLFFLDSDDLIDISTLNDFLFFLQKEEIDWDLIRVGITKKFYKKKKNIALLPLFQKSYFSLNKYLWEVFICQKFTTITSVTHIYSRNIFLKNIFAENILSEDMEHFFRISQHINKIKTTTFNFYYHINDRRNSITNSRKKEMLKDQKNIYKQKIKIIKNDYLLFILCSFYWFSFFANSKIIIKGFFSKTILSFIKVFWKRGK